MHANSIAGEEKCQHLGCGMGIDTVTARRAKCAGENKKKNEIKGKRGWKVSVGSVLPQAVGREDGDTLNGEYDRYATEPSGLLPDEAGKYRSHESAEIVEGNV